ncbi:MAG: type II toxin-antitoxin system HicB family antitoxin [Runella sp.]
MEEIIFEIEQSDSDGGYVAHAVLSENAQIVTQGDTIEELKMMIKDALECHFDDESEIPKKIILKFIRQEVLDF